MDWDGYKRHYETEAPKIHTTRRDVSIHKIFIDRIVIVVVVACLFGLFGIFGYAAVRGDRINDAKRVDQCESQGGRVVVIGDVAKCLLDGAVVGTWRE